MQAKGRKAEQAEITREALVKVARGLFAERGYAHSSIGEIIGLAGVSRGALYHHFRDKRDLFQAVFEDVESDLAQQLLSASGGERDSGELLRAGLHAFLDACAQPDVQRISILDAPSVLGWETWRKIEAKYGFGLLMNALRVAMESGAIRPQRLEPLAHVLFGALLEAAMVIGRADDVEATRAEMAKTLEVLLKGLRPDGAQMPEDV